MVGKYLNFSRLDQCVVILSTGSPEWMVLRGGDFQQFVIVCASDIEAARYRWGDSSGRRTYGRLDEGGRGL